MVRTVVRDVFFLAQKSEPATKDDLGTVQDLLDTCDHLKGIII